MSTEPEQNFEKLYKHTSTKWLRLPIATRGIGDELLRVCDPTTGFVCDSCEPCDVSLRLRAHENESPLIKTAIETLLGSGFLTEYKGRLYIAKHFERNKERKARHSEHMREVRERERRESREAGEPSPGKTDKTDPNKPDPTDPRRVSLDADVKRVFEAWKQDTGKHRAKMDRGDKRWRRIVARLKDGFTADELILAITHRRNDPWLMGEDPKSTRVFDDVDTLLRDRAQVERLIALVKRHEPPPRNGQQTKQPSAGYRSERTTRA